MKKRGLLIIIFFFSFLISYSQNTTKGKLFWLAFMENLDVGFNGPAQFTIVIHSDKDAHGFIKVPSTGLALPFNVKANTPLRYLLPNSLWYTNGSDVKSNKGILIESDAIIDVTAFHFRVYFSDATKVLPISELGKKYTILTHKDDKNTNPSAFVIVSADDNNEIEITTSALTLGLRPAGLPYSVVLNKGETYQVQAMDDLSGTTIKSKNNKILAVFAGARQASISSSTCAHFNGPDNHLYEQLMPDELLSKKYIVVPLKTQGVLPISVTTLSDNTAIMVNHQLVSSNGRLANLEISEAALIEADQKLAVAFFSKSATCNELQFFGDPNMMIARPIGFVSRSETFYSPDTGTKEISNSNIFLKHYVNIVTKTNALETIELDGKNILDSFKTVLADTSYSYAQISLASGYHQLRSDSGFAAVVYGFGYYDAYSYTLGYDLWEDAVIDTSDYNGSNQQELDVIISPNPILDKEEMTLSFTLPDNTLYEASYSIYDARGRLINEGVLNISNASFGKSHINIFKLASALYFIDIKVGGKVFTKKFVKM